MKTKLLPVFFILFSIRAFSQSFDGVSSDGDILTAVKKYKEKGYEVISKDRDLASLTGKAAGKKINLYITTTPKTKIIDKVVIFLPQQDNWYSLLGDYEKYVEILTTKYGSPSSNYKIFKDPYKEGDGNEMTALLEEKCFYKTFWLNNISNTNILIQISDTKQVQITYENEKNAIIREKEKLEIEKSVF